VVSPRFRVAGEVREPALGLVVWRPGSAIPHRFISSPSSHLSMASDGATMAVTLTEGKGVAWWDTATRQPFCTQAGDPLVEEVPTLSPDGRQVALFLRKGHEGCMVLLDRESGARRRLPGTDINSGFYSAASPQFDCDGHRLAIVNRIGGMLQLIDVAAARVTESFPLGRGSETIDSASFSPDGEVIATAFRGPDDMHGQIELLHLATRRVLLTLRPYEFGASNVRFSHDGRVLASAIPKADGDGNAGIILWRFDSPRGPRANIK
jgi:Tol biopolymer transport system component